MTDYVANHKKPVDIEKHMMLFKGKNLEEIIELSKSNKLYGHVEKVSYNQYSYYIRPWSYSDCMPQLIYSNAKLTESQTMLKVDTLVSFRLSTTKFKGLHCYEVAMVIEENNAEM